jgi:release factor glutamine methyltransferase
MTFEAAEQSLTTALSGLYENREAATIAGMVMEFITGKSKMDRWLQKNEPLSEADLKCFQQYSNQLLTGKPIQYVFGEAWFAGMRLQVNEHTLIPRPETEELVNLCASWAAANRINDAPLKILEVGTGSGCIAIALQKKLPGAQITAVDISSEAIDVATTNAIVNNTAIKCITLDFLDETCWPGLGSYDIVISNPPYIADI